jgi:cell division transport system permease protein
MRDGARPRHKRTRDELGLRRAMGELVLPLVVGAMTFLAALAASGAVATGMFARQWRGGAEAAATVQVPDPDAMLGDATRLDRALALLRGDPAVAAAQALTPAERSALLRPWFGGDVPAALALPGVIEATLRPGQPTPALAARLAQAVPGAALDDPQGWADRLRQLADSLQACAWLALAIVASVAALVTAVVVRGGLLARREAIEIVHGLGATDAYIARHFASRAGALAARGAALGALAALPVLLALAALAQPFAGTPATAPQPPGLIGALGDMPVPLWATLLLLPLAAGAIGYATAALAVRRWLRRLP